MFVTFIKITKSVVSTLLASLCSYTTEVEYLVHLYTVWTGGLIVWHNQSDTSCSLRYMAVNSWLAYAAENCKCYFSAADWQESGVFVQINFVAL